MIDEIMRLLLNYSNKNADKDFFIKLGNILMKHNNITSKEYRGIIFLTRKEAVEKWNYDNLSSCLTKGFYNENDKKIYLIMQNLGDKTKRELDEYGLSNKEYRIFTNLEKSIHFIREFEHLVQDKGKPGLEGLLIKDCIKTNSKRTYDLSPREHFANLHSTLIAYIIAEKLLPKQAINYFKKCLKGSLLNPYIHNNNHAKTRHYPNNNPVGEYYFLTGIKMPVTKDLINKMNITERVIFELPISNAEFSNLDIKFIMNPTQINEILEKYAKPSVIKTSKKK